jgi:hypothetical protein
MVTRMCQKNAQTNGVASLCSPEKSEFGEASLFRSKPCQAFAIGKGIVKGIIKGNY